MCRRILIFLSICALAPVQAQVCPVQTLDWDAETPGSVPLSSSYSVGNETFNVVLSGDTAAVQAITVPTQLPAIGPFFLGNNAAIEQQYIIAALLTDLGDDEVVITIDIGTPGVGVDQLAFNLFDVDGETDAAFLRQERYAIRGSLNGVDVPPVLTTTTQMNVEMGSGDILGNEPVQGGLETGLADAEGVLGILFDQPVDQVVITWSIDNGVPPNIGSSPGFAIDDLQFCTAPLPEAQPVPAISAWGILLLTLLIGSMVLLRAVTGRMA